LAALALDPDARRLAAFGVEQHHIGGVDGSLALDHAPELALGAGNWRVARRLLGTDALLDHVQTLDIEAFLRGLYPQHTSAFAASLARDHLDVVARADLQLPTAGSCSGATHHSTSGARDTIFMKLRSRSSRATGPNTRVPRGLFWSSMITAAFSSN